MQFGTGSTTELTQKREGQSTQNDNIRPYIIGSERSGGDHCTWDPIETGMFD